MSLLTRACTLHRKLLHGWKGEGRHSRATGALSMHCPCVGGGGALRSMQMRTILHQLHCTHPRFVSCAVYVVEMLRLMPFSERLNGAFIH